MDVDVQRFVGEMGWEVKRSGAQLYTGCPLCAKPWKFYMSVDSGAWDCKVCGKAGSLYQLKELLGLAVKIVRQQPDPAPLAIPLAEWDKIPRPSGNVAAFLNGRDLWDRKDMFRLRQKDNYILMPYIRGDYVVFSKGRNVSDKSDMFRKPSGAPSILFGLQLLDKTYPIVLLVEGEFDAIAGYEYGLKNVLSVPNGAKGFHASWLNDLEFAEVILIGYDNDKDGDDGAEYIANKLGQARCRRVKWPKKDLNECLQENILLAEIVTLLGEAKDVMPKDLRQASDVYEALLLDKGEGRGAQTKFNEINSKLGGIRPGEITVLVGDTGSGKSTFGINMVLDAMERGDHALIISSEMSPQRVVSKLASMIAQVDYLAQSDADRQKVREFFSAHPLCLLDIHGPVSETRMAETVAYCAERFGVKFVLLDHLHFFIQAEPEHERQALESYMRAIVSVKMKTKAHIFVIAHPRATQKDGEKVGMASIKGASGIKQDADNVLAIHREMKGQKDMVDPPVRFKLFKNRYLGEIGEFKLDYTPSSQSYFNHIGTGENE